MKKSRELLCAVAAVSIIVAQISSASELDPVLPGTEVDSAQLKTLPNTDVVRNRLYKDQLKLAYIKNPDIFKAHRAALDGGPQVFLWKAYITGQMDVAEAIRKIPGFSIGEGVSVDLGGLAQVTAQIEYENWQSERNSRERAALLRRPDQLEEVADRIANQMYGDPIETVKDMVDFTRDKGALPHEVDVKALSLDHPDLASAMERLRLDKMSPEQQEKFLSGKMTPDEFFSITNLSKTEINVTIKAVTKVIVDKPEIKVEKPDDTALALAKHKRFVEERSAEVFAISSIIGLVDKKAARTISEVGQGSLKIYDAVQGMVLTGALTLTGVGAVAAGLSAVMSGFGGSDDATAGMLAEVLENQRIMIAQLKRIESKLDILNQKVDYITSMVELNHEQVMTNIDKIREGLAAISQDQFDYSYRNTKMFQDSDLKPLLAEIASLNELFDNRLQSNIWTELTNCQTGVGACTEAANATMQQVRTTLGKIKFHAQEGIKSSAFRPTLDLGKLPGGEAAALIFRTAVEDRNGAIPSLNAWLAHGDAGARALIDQDPIPHPAYFSLLMDAYLNLALRLPLQNAVKDTNVSEFCEAASEIEELTAQARNASPKAWTENLAAITAVVEAYRRVVTSISSDFPFGPEIRPVDAFPFQTWQAQEVADYVVQLGGEPLAELATRLGLFTLKEEHKEGTRSVFDDRIPPGTSVRESWNFDVKTLFPTETAIHRLNGNETDANGNTKLKVISVIEQFYPDDAKFFTANTQHYVDEISRGTDVYRNGWSSGLDADFKWDGYFGPPRRPMLNALILQAILEKRDGINARLPAYLRDDTPALDATVQIPAAIENWERARAATDTVLRMGYGRLLELDEAMAPALHTIRAAENQGRPFIAVADGQELHTRMLNLSDFVAKHQTLPLPKEQELSSAPGYGDPVRVRGFFLAASRYSELAPENCSLAMQ